MLSIRSVISESLLHPNRFQYSNPPFFFDEINHIWMGGGGGGRGGEGKRGQNGHLRAFAISQKQFSEFSPNLCHSLR